MIKINLDYFHSAQGEVNAYSENFCKRFQNPTKEFINENIEKYTKVDDCSFLLKNVEEITTRSDNTQWLLIITTGLGIIFFVFILVITRRWLKRKSFSNNKMQNIPVRKVELSIGK